MEESEEILLSSLQNGGVSVPNNVTSIKDVTPMILVSICGQSLNLIEKTSSFRTSLPDSMADKFKICTEISSAIKNLGYIGDISYYKFLHPSEEDLHKLIRFLVERLSESQEGVKVGEVNVINARRTINEDNFKSTLEDSEGVDSYHQKVGVKLKEQRLKNELPESTNCENETMTITGSYKGHIIPPKVEEEVSDDILISGKCDLSQNETANIVSGKDLTEEPGKSEGVSGDEGTAVASDDKQMSVSEQKETSLKEQLSKITIEAESLQNHEQKLMEAVNAKTTKSRGCEEEFELLKAVGEMAFDDSHPIEFYLQQLDEQIDTRKRNLVERESQWNSIRKSLEEKRRSLEESIYANDPEAQEKLQKQREVELERQSVLYAIQKREDEYSKLLADLEKHPKVPSRRSYIDRIKEITKNSRKQDADIERILKETRELQLESNSIQERLHRTYVIVDEMIFREAKRDSVGRQAYRLLTSIHESFEQVSEKILATDRVRREVAEYEKKLEGMASGSLNVDKLQADLDAIRKENEHIEQCLKE